jgi:hypothetical protein
MLPNRQNSNGRPVLRRYIEISPVVLMAFVVLLEGCTIQQTVTPVRDVKIAEIAIIDNPRVRGSFGSVLQSAVEEQGLTTQVAPSTSSPTDYPYALTYTANWKWDMALYMSYAQITVYEKGKVIGKAVYDSTGGDANLGKFINAEDKVRELVGALFPALRNGASALRDSDQPSSPAQANNTASAQPASAPASPNMATKRIVDYKAKKDASGEFVRDKDGHFVLVPVYEDEQEK